VSDAVIRSARESDLPSVEKLVVGLIGSLADGEGTNVETVLENSRGVLRDANAHILLAEDDGAVVGLVSFSTRRTLTHEGLSGLIDELIVGEGHRGRGVGRQLVRAAVYRCRELGCCEVEVSTEFSNAEAREFYRSCGFKERGVILEMDL